MYKTEREELVEKLIEKGIRDEAVIKAIREVERHKFLSDAMKHHAYKDVALPIGYGQTISQPYTVAFMTQELRLIKGSKVLEIGTGSGYQAAILENMGMKVYSIERQFEIYSATQKFFDKMGIRAHLKYGDGTIGWDEYAPFDGIIVTAGAPFVPKPLLSQLKIGGRLVIPVGEAIQIMTLFIRKGPKDFEKHEFGEFRFVPLLEDKN